MMKIGRCVWTLGMILRRVLIAYVGFSEIKEIREN